MKTFLILCVWIVCAGQVRAQYHTSEARSWDRYPPEVQLRGFGVHSSELIQMDDDPQLEEVFLFSADNGHYPYFDVFRTYYVIVGYHTKEVKYRSDITFSTERKLVAEDRNDDGKSEIYRRYFREGKFTVDKEGNHLSTAWAYDSISF